MKTFNELLAFLLELCALAALAVWGIHAADGTAAKIALAVGAPLVAAIVWGRFVAPRAPTELSSRARFAMASLIFAAAAAGLIAAGYTLFGIALAAAFLINRLVLVAMGER
jgi:hypothetical protein